jgi:proteasome assembly chaperone (PAC2) family protein
MAEQLKLHHPWLVAVWPGMGNVGLSAGYYLMAKLGMHQVAEFEARDLFDVDSVEIKDGIIQPGRRPRSRLFLWQDPEKKRDIVVFLGEAQPPVGKYQFCHKLVQSTREMGVERIFTFAAMATQMHPRNRSRVFGAATDAESLNELMRLELQIIKDGQIGGLNGVLLGAAAERGIRGTCLLGELPQMFAQLPYPKAARSILEVFTTMTGIELDFAELSEQVRLMEEQLSELLSRVEQAYQQEAPAEEEVVSAEPAAESKLSSEQTQHIEELFERASKDRSKAFELKQELDRFGVFKDYEDRFLDLFKKPEQ